MSEAKPQPGQWWIEIPGFVPTGAYETREEAIWAGSDLAKANGCVQFAIGKWKCSVTTRGADWEWVKVEGA